MGSSVAAGSRAATVAAAPRAAQSPDSAAPIYLAFGDSITAGFGDTLDDPSGQGYPPRLQSLLNQHGINATVINAGLLGETTADGLSRLSGLLATTPATALLLMEGTNDISAKVSIETIIQNLGMMAKRAERHGMTAVHVTVIPRMPDADTDATNVTTAALAGQIRELAFLAGRQLVDPFEVFFHLTPNVFTSDYVGDSDHLHPNAAGYDLLAATFADVLTGVDHVPPVTGLVSPPDQAMNVQATLPIEIDLFDFGAGINLSATQLSLNGSPVTPTVTGDQHRIGIVYQPPQPLAGIVTVHLTSQDLANPPNVLDRDISSFIITGTTFLPGDLNHDGRVDGADLVVLALAFGAHRFDSNFNLAADLNGDGIVDGRDLAILAANFGKSSF